MTHHLGYLGLAFYAASFACYARILYVPNPWLGRIASVLLAGGIILQYYDLLERSQFMHTRSVRRSLRLDVAFRVAFCDHLPGA